MTTEQHDQVYFRCFNTGKILVQYH